MKDESLSDQQGATSVHLSAVRSSFDFGRCDAPVDARGLANFLLDIAHDKSLTLSITSLLKIIYFAHGWHLAKYDSALVGQPFEAWKFGPVIRVVYDEFRQESGGVIKGRARTFSAALGEYVTAAVNFDTDISKFLEGVLVSYAKFHPYTLSDMTHDPDSPWTAVWNGAEQGVLPGRRISNGLIRQYFLQLNETDMFKS